MRIKIMRINKMFAPLLVGLFITACAYFQAPQTNTIISGSTDSREYQYLRLANDMQVVLVSDPGADKAAASLEVAVGSAQDPEHRPGLAHFLEHMLFLGTTKYPEPGSYQSFISSHGGQHNAYTAFENTNYFFDIDPVYLGDALDRFAQFFVAPLFTEAYVEREKNAVHSEYMAKIKDDQRRSLEVFRQMVNPAHPVSHFSVGNLETLASRPGESVRDDLLAFYQRYYSANLMSLAVVGPQSLKELRAMISDRFDIIEDRHATEETITEPLFKQGALPRTVLIEPAAEVRKLTFTFPVPDISAYYREKPLLLLGHVIGHEGEGSLLSLLKKRGWAVGLSAGSGLDYRGGSSFDISIQLTEAGLNHRDEITTAVYQTVAKLHDKAQWRRLYEEQAALGMQQFNYQEVGSPTHLAMSLSHSVSEYPVQDILRGPYLMSDYSPELIEQYLGYINPDNCLMTVIAPGLSTSQQTQRYKTAYQVEQPTAKQQQLWRNPPQNSAIQLPVPNPFIADDLSLIDAPVTSVPAQVNSGDGVRLWYRADDHFELPKGAITLYLNRVSKDDASEMALLNVYARMIGDQLNELAYPASLAGLDYAVSVQPRGLSLKISGFNDKQQLLLEQILVALHSPHFEQQRFTDIRAELIRHADNADKKMPYQRLFDSLGDVLNRHEWPQSILRDKYAQLTLSDLNTFAHAFTGAVSVDGLVYGNFTREDVDTVDSLLRRYLTIVPRDKVRGLEVIKLPEESTAYRESSIYNDSALLLYIQSFDIDLQRRAAMALTAQILDADFYTVLRTEKQLGYVVSSGVLPVVNVPGIYFLVQSPVMDNAGLQKEINSYLGEVAHTLNQQDSADFARHQQSLISRLREQPKNIWQQSEIYWRDIQLGFSDFDFTEQIIAQISGLTQAQWQHFFTTEVASGKARRLWLYSSGNTDAKPPVSDDKITDLPTFKREQKTYRFD